MRSLPVLTLLALTACGDATLQDVSQDVADVQADQAALEQRLAELEAALAAKADQTAMTTALAAKADQAAMELALAGKADKLTTEEALDALRDDIDALAGTVDPDFLDELEGLVAEVDGLADALAGKADNAALTALEARFEDYPTTEELDQYVTLDDLAGYATTSSLSGYVQSGALSSYAPLTALEAYVQKTALDLRLQGYAPLADLEDLAEVAITELERPTNGIVTYNVSTAAALTGKLRELERVRIPSDVQVVVQLANGDYSFNAPLHFNHVNGRRVTLRGNVSNPASVRLLFPSGTSGLVVDGQHLGKLEGVHLVGSGSGVTSGVNVLNNGSVRVGPSVAANQFRTGWNAENGAVLDATGTVATGNVLYGYFASRGSVLLAGGALAEDSPSGLGFYAGSLSMLFADRASAEDNSFDGFYAAAVAYIDASDAKSLRSKKGNGVVATQGSYVHAPSAQAIGNRGHGGFAAVNSMIGLTGNSNFSGNTAAQLNPSDAAVGGNYGAWIPPTHPDAPNF